MTNSERGSTKDDIIAAALASGATHQEAGATAGVSERTIRRRLEQPEFTAQVARQRDELVSRTADKLTSLTTTAVDTLSSLVSAVDTPAGVKLRAAMGILAMHRVWRDATELENRLRRVENLIATGQIEQGESP